MKKRKKTSALPKTKEKFLNSIKPFCCFRLPVLTPEYIYARLYEQNFIEIDDEGDLTLINRKFHGFPDKYREPQHWVHELNDIQIGALTKCFSWVTSLEMPPTSLGAFRTSLEQLAVEKCEVGVEGVLEYLVGKKIVKVDDDNRVTYL